MDTPLRAVARHALSNPCKKKGASLIVAGGLCFGLDGVGHVFPPCFIPPETKIHAARCQDMLRSYYDPRAKTFCGADAVFQQGGAPSHTARTPLVRCSVKLWRGPRSRPILSPDDCALWGSWESLVAQENPTDATTPHAAIINTHMMWHFTRRLREALLPTVPKRFRKVVRSPPSDLLNCTQTQRHV